MVSLVAYSPLDGWAYTEAGRTYHLIRPPYSTENMTPVTQEEAYKGAAVQGFRLLEHPRAFSGWSELLDFLNREVRQARSHLGQDLSEMQPGEELLAIAPPEVLSEFLDKVERELLPAGCYDHATRLLTAMLKQPRVRSDSRLVERATQLLITAVNARFTVLEGDELAAAFPLANERYGSVLAEISSSVQRRRSTFTPLPIRRSA